MHKELGILYLTYDGLTDPLGQSQVLPYLEGLSEKGYAITIVSFEKPGRFEIGFESINQRCNTANLDWKPLKYHKYPAIISTLLDIINLRKMIRRLQARRPFSIVHCRSYVTAIAGLWLKEKSGVKFVFDMRGFWADERVEGGLWNLRNPLYLLIYKFFKKKEKELLTKSDHIISLTENAAKEIRTWGVAAPVSVIPCCVDTALFDPNKITEHEKTSLRKELQIDKDEFVLIYLGSWGTWYLTNEILQFFEKFKLIFTRSKLLIVSFDKINLKDYSLKSDVIIASSQRSKIPIYISIASAAIFLIKPSFSKKASSATKLGELLAMNVPVITNSGWGDIAELHNRSIILLKDQVINNWDLIKQNRFTRNYCVENLSLEMGIEKYSRIYESLSGGD